MKSSLTAVRQGAKVPSSDIFAVGKWLGINGPNQLVKWSILESSSAAMVGVSMVEVAIVEHPP